ncbi:hypothetical protein ACJZ2D_013337 [Fusarium nematophilum]
MDELTDLSDDLFDHLSLSEKAGPTTIDPSKGYLTSLPSEMLHRIVAEKSLERRELKNLGLASSRLLASIRPRFYQSNRFETFRKAIQAADLECIERCEAYNAAPPDIIWRVGRKAEHCWRPHGERHQHHRPIEILTESFDRGDVPGDRVLQVLRWLIDRDADIQDRPYFDAKRPDRFWRPYYYHMPGVFLAILQDPMHRKRVDGACEIIRYLSGRGYTIPTETEPRRFPVLERCGAVFRPVDRRRTAPKAAMEIMLRPACPPWVLEIFSQGLPVPGHKPDVARRRAVHQPALPATQRAAALFRPQAQHEDGWLGDPVRPVRGPDRPAPLAGGVPRRDRGLLRGQGLLVGQVPRRQRGGRASTKPHRGGAGAHPGAGRGTRRRRRRR